MDTFLKVTQVRSLSGRPETQRRTIRGLGLGKIRRTVFLEDTPAVRGAVQKVRHLVVFEVVSREQRDEELRRRAARRPTVVVEPAAAPVPAEEE